MRTSTVLQIVGAVGVSVAIASRWLWLGAAILFAFVLLFGALLEADEPAADDGES